VVVSRGVRAALNAEDQYGAYIAFGVSVLFGVQALVNMAVAMSMLPTKGLTLPFVSFGGSSLLVMAAAMGILLNVSRRAPSVVNRRVAPGKHAAGRAEASALLVSEAGFAPEARVRAGMAEAG
jgi:cell division protein FtsW